MMNEIWKDIPGYEGKYQASNTGFIRNSKGLILKPMLTKLGYYRVELFNNKTRKKHHVHRLIWETFNGAIPTGLQINHINEIKTDNALSNLNLMTPKENINYGTGIERGHKQLRKPVLQYDKSGNFIKEWSSLVEAKNYYGQAVGDCVRGYCPTAFGFTWKYKETNGN